MVNYLTHRGVPAQMKGFHETPLAMACRGLHFNIVDFLLANGVDLNFLPKYAFPVLPLHQSATSSSVTIARKLLDHGAHIYPQRMVKGRNPILWWAFTQEHMSIVQLLLERGAAFDGGKSDTRRGECRWIGHELAEIAYYFGYESVAEILREEHGFEIINPLPVVPRKPTFTWREWAEAIIS